MAELDDDAIRALWAIYDASGVRPEYLIPVLWFESGFDPAAKNAAGHPYYGINQIFGGRIPGGMSPEQWMQQSAATQIAAAVAPYFARAVKSYGPIRSATRAYQANFEPASLPTARSLHDIIEHRGTRAYAANAAALDPTRTGAITVGSLAYVMRGTVQAPPVQRAIVRAYVLRPDETPHDPVYGEDFGDPLVWVGILAAVGGALAARR